VTLGAAIALLLGCSSDPTPEASPGTSTVPQVSAAPSSLGPPKTVEVEPPITFAAADPSAVDVFVGLADRLPMSDDERACAADHLAADPALLGRVKGGASPNSADFGALAALVQRCRQSVTFGQQFVTNVGAQHPDLSDDQRRCLQTKYGELSPEDLDRILGAGLDPSGSDAPRGVKVLDDLLRSCGVDQ
jgi:hypothetical protein